MQLTSTKLHRAYDQESLLWERELVDYIRRCQTHATGEDSLSATAASLARLELRRCLQARTLVRRLSGYQAEDVAAALRAAGFSDHASALLRGNWRAAGLLIE